jgi:hypothetical protein
MAETKDRSSLLRSIESDYRIYSEEFRRKIAPYINEGEVYAGTVAWWEDEDPDGKKIKKRSSASYQKQGLKVRFSPTDVVTTDGDGWPLCRHDPETGERQHNALQFVSC